MAPNLAPPLAAPPPVYTADDAVRDALASPLVLVGVGGWTGYFRHLSCIYRNAQVIVVDVRCNKHETYQFKVVIDSPGRGRVDIVADALQKTAPLSTVQRAGYETFEVSGAGPWLGAPEPALATSYDEITGIRRPALAEAGRLRADDPHAASRLQPRSVLVARGVR